VIHVDHLDITQGDFALHDVSFDVPQGRYAVLMGRTGCGKTTLLEAVCGLRKVESGRITLPGNNGSSMDVTHMKPAARGVGYVPQDGAMFNTMSVYDHLAFALRIRKWSANDIDKRVCEMGDLLGIEHLLSRMPIGLSGGEKQRVSLGRALAFRPRVLCLDEPLSALDDETRQQMYTLLKTAQQHEHVTALHVTHSMEEAKHLGDIIFRVRDGKVREIDSEHLTSTEHGETD
jgi:ABC-type sugar transport system ATPase subunit